VSPQVFDFGGLHTVALQRTCGPRMTVSFIITEPGFCGQLDQLRTACIPICTALQLVQLLPNKCLCC
jgi:hypothetical protein